MFNVKFRKLWKSCKVIWNHHFGKIPQQLLLWYSVDCILKWNVKYNLIYSYQHQQFYGNTNSVSLNSTYARNSLCELFIFLIGISLNIKMPLPHVYPVSNIAFTKWNIISCRLRFIDDIYISQQIIDRQNVESIFWEIETNFL